ncbi:MAG TPA: dipeptide ABC transporter ATP-binding protein [Alphaproteobacteria bacterium]|nr:dipeptide ABC transporter ATP-binding protein [Alphaproteobacteria bacterium]
MSDLLSLAGLTVHFDTPQGTVRAVDGVSLTLKRGETLGLVGESGCGKSTLGKAIVGLVKPTAGSIQIDGIEIAGLSRRALRKYRARLQMIFQDPYASLNPRLRVGKIIEEPLSVHGVGGAKERREAVLALAARVGLRPEMLTRHPHEFSGGQRQRIGIARALTLNPDIIICDEPVSALDVSVQAQVVNLLGELQSERGLAYLFISHDLSVVQHLAHRVAVMYLGKIVEQAPRKSLWARPLHPYTRALLAAVPVPDPDQPKLIDQPMVEGELPSPLNPPSGCRFRTRCPFAQAICAEQEPPLREVAEGHTVACHFVKREADGTIVAP